MTQLSSKIYIFFISESWSINFVVRTNRGRILDSKWLRGVFWLIDSEFGRYRSLKRHRCVIVSWIVVVKLRGGFWILFSWMLLTYLKINGTRWDDFWLWTKEVGEAIGFHRLSSVGQRHSVGAVDKVTLTAATVTITSEIAEGSSVESSITASATATCTIALTARVTFTSATAD